MNDLARKLAELATVAALMAGGIAPLTAADEGTKKPSDFGDLIGNMAAAAQVANATDHITVTASGKAIVKPDVAEIHAAVTGSAAMAADALKKFNDNRRRALEVLKNLKLEQLTVEGTGASIRSANANSQRMVQMFGGNTNTEQPGTVTVTETLLIRVAHIDRMKDEEVFNLAAKVVDAAKDAGLTMTSGSTSMIEVQLRGEAKSELVRFHTTGLARARKEAVKNAMQSARKKADELAALYNAKVVRIISVREGLMPPASSGGSGIPAFYAMMMGGDSGDHADADSSASSDLKPITTAVSLEVQFAVVGPEGALGPSSPSSHPMRTSHSKR